MQTARCNPQKAMKCPKCKDGVGWVLLTREKNGIIRRRRECKKCGYRFTTTEIPVEMAKGILIRLSDLIKEVKKV